MILVLALLACSPEKTKDSGDAPADTDTADEDTADSAEAETGGDTSPQAVDADGDGVAAQDGDCDDADPARFPGNAETCDGVDDDCDGAVDEGFDADGDGSLACAGDCDDGDAAVNPAATEVCGNGVDDDCDGGANGCPPLGDMALADADAILTGEANGDYAGFALAFAGDMDGDGADDLVVGAFGRDGGSRWGGAAYVFYGLPRGETSLSTADARLLGDAVADGLGYAVSGAGDVDGDGLADAIVGAPYADDGGSNAGAAYLLTGGATGDVAGSSATATLIGEDPDDMAGIAVVGLGDMDGDGLAEVGVGTYGDDDGGRGAGAVYVVAGGTSGDFDLSTAAAKFVGEDPGDEVGLAARSAGDLNGDGIADLLIGARGDNTSGGRCGATYVIYLPVSGTFDLSGADAKLYGDAATEEAFRPAAGDLDGDGDPDLVVGAYAAPFASIVPGAVYVVLDVPNDSYDLGNADTIVRGDTDGALVGSAASVGDVDGDGTGDLVVGANGTEEGAVYLFYGPLAGGSVSTADADSTLAGDRGDYAGNAVDATGDADGDGFADILVGADYSSEGVATAGAAYLVLGGVGW